MTSDFLALNLYQFLTVYGKITTEYLILLRHVNGNDVRIACLQNLCFICKRKT